ncbi:ubiquinol-cytochrome c reductase core subunit 1 [Monascus purpureus]|uniref:Cytochrome b-c1 complex subunit 2, mitochondrial n=1 Tax=Monascus purpureus TaxID=5098 RepID=A0A507QLB1_MONPU|nr:ubiquinol-cytochrome c reductase core subunit 1 [Monascus purpureus]BDD59167.1 hypothetical protein MAP00_004397 [Monascus purpureus]
MMLSRSTFGRNAPRALQTVASRRAMASAASGFQYDISESAGVKVANRQGAGPTSTLAVVAKAGTRFQPLPGFSDALAQFAFKSTLKRSALRITREVELLGGELSSKNSRENIVLKAKFLSNDLPYFAELLAEVASQTKFPAHELKEHVAALLHFKQKSIAAHPEVLAVEAAHGVAFHRGLGENITEVPFEKYVNVEALAEFAKEAYSKPNVAVVSSGADSAELSKWVGEFFKELPSGSTIQSEASKYYGGETRISSKTGNAVVVGFPGSSTFGTPGYKPEVAVLASLLGGESTIKWTPGFSLLAKATEGFSGVHASTKNNAYSDAGLLTITVSGATSQIGEVSKSVVEAIKKVAAGEVPSEEVKKALALAKFRALESVENIETGLEATGSALLTGGKPYHVGEIAQAIDSVTAEKVQETAKSLLSGKASVASVGDLHSLPFAEELGLTV